MDRNFCEPGSSLPSPAPAPSAAGAAAARSIVALLDESADRAETVAKAHAEPIRAQEVAAAELSGRIARELGDLEQARLATTGEQARLATTGLECAELRARAERDAAARVEELVSAGRAEEQLALGRARVAEAAAAATELQQSQLTRTCELQRQQAAAAHGAALRQQENEL